MAKPKALQTLEGRIMSGVTSAAPTSWGECVYPEGKVVIFDCWCKKCGICTEFCPTGALKDNEHGYPYLAEPDKCTLCGLCWLRCPDMAIIKGPELPENEPTEQEVEKTRQMLCEAGDEESCELPQEEKQEKPDPKSVKKGESDGEKS